MSSILCAALLILANLLGSTRVKSEAVMRAKHYAQLLGLSFQLVPRAYSTLCCAVLTHHPVHVCWICGAAWCVVTNRWILTSLLLWPSMEVWLGGWAWETWRTASSCIMLQIWDPAELADTAISSIQHKNRCSPYIDLPLYGKVLATVVEGQMVYDSKQGLSRNTCGRLLH